MASLMRQPSPVLEHQEATDWAGGGGHGCGGGVVGKIAASRHERMFGARPSLPVSVAWVHDAQVKNATRATLAYLILLPSLLPSLLLLFL